MKPSNDKARALLAKLEALAERGIDGEKESAMRKLAKLKTKFDFNVAPEKKTEDLFSGMFQAPSRGEIHFLTKFAAIDFDVANSIKWAIENATGLQSVYKNGGEIWVESGRSSVSKLEAIAKTISDGFLQLWDRFSKVDGVHQGDRSNFIRGLYDGMMNDEKAQGQPLPSRFEPAKKIRVKRKSLNRAPGIGLHPYSVALNMGKQIRFCVPAGDVIGSFEKQYLTN